MCLMKNQKIFLNSLVLLKYKKVNFLIKRKHVILLNFNWVFLYIYFWKIKKKLRDFFDKKNF